MGYTLPGSSVHGILQAGILEWVAISYSRGSSGPRDQTISWVSSIGRRILTTAPRGKPLLLQESQLSTRKDRGKISFPPLDTKARNQHSWHRMPLPPASESKSTTVRAKGNISHGLQSFWWPSLPLVKPSPPLLAPPAAVEEISCSSRTGDPTGMQEPPKCQSSAGAHASLPLLFCFPALRTMLPCTPNVSKRVCAQTALPLLFQ